MTQWYRWKATLSSLVTISSQANSCISFNDFSYYNRDNFTSLGPNKSPEALNRKRSNIHCRWLMHLGFVLVNHICQYLCAHNFFIICCLCSCSASDMRRYWFTEDIMNLKQSDLTAFNMRVRAKTTNNIGLCSTTKNVNVNLFFSYFLRKCCWQHDKNMYV